MDRRTLLLACMNAGLSSLALPVPAQTPPRIVFLNPGEAVERGAGPFWPLVASAMSHAATSLGMNLEILNGERDHLMTLRQAEQLAKGAVPDYLVIVNEKLTAVPILKLFAGSRTKVLLIHNDLTPSQRRELGNERERIVNWIGTMTSDARRGSYLLMEHLYGLLGKGEPQVIGITGDPATPVSTERAQGVDDYVARARRGRVLQLVFGDWTYADGEQKAAILLARHPQTNVIWSANDTMALGALHAVKARRAPVLVGGMGGWPDALASIADGGLAATAAGNFTIGAWAMVLLYDHHRGCDFAVRGGVNQTFDYLVVHRGNVDRYDQLLMKRLNVLDVRRYSKVLNPQPGPYRFSLADMVNGSRAR